MIANYEGRDEIRVALIGYGLAGESFHAPLIRATAGLEIAAIVTANPERQRAARRAHPGAAVVDTADALWKDAAGLDLVVVASPNRTHVPLALAALAAGLHVVVDKPLAPTAAEGRRLVEQAGRRGRVLTVFQNRRWDGAFLTARRLLREGAVGEPYRFEARFERWRPALTGGWRERGTPEEAGGILFDLGSHLIDQALVLCGPAAHVYAELDRRRPAAEADDDAFVAITHASGVRSHLFMSAVTARADSGLRLMGSRAAYVKHGTDVQEAALRRGDQPGGDDWGADPRQAWGVLGAGDDARPVPTEPGAYQQFYEGVVRTLREGAPPPVDPADAVAALDVIEAARRSETERRIISI